MPSSLDEALLIAIQKNPSILVAKKSILSNKEHYEKDKSLYYPTIDIELSQAWFDENGESNYNVESRTAMLYLRYNLYNGNADKLLLEQDITRLKESEQFKASVERQLFLRLSSAWVGMVKLKEQLVLLTSLKSYAQKTSDAYIDEFSLGRRKLIDLISIESDNNSAKTTYENVKYDYLLSQFQILEAMGTLQHYFEKISHQKSLLTKECQLFDIRSLGKRVVNYMNSIKV